MTKWIEAQDKRNRWDYFCPVTAVVKRGEPFVRVKVLLSSNVFRIAFKECRSEVSTLIESRLIEGTREEANGKKEWELQNAALAKAPALPARRPILVFTDELKT